MFKRKAIASLLVSMVLAMSLGLVGCGGGSSTSTGSADETTGGLTTVVDGKLTIGSDCDYPPFIEMDGENAIGYEKDLLQAIADEIGLELNFLPPQNFDTILATIASNTKIDVGASSFTITDERKELVNFSLSYFDSNQAVVTMVESAHTNAMDLEGKVVGAQSGTTGADWVRENLGSSTTLKEFNQASEVMAALVAGDIEAAFYDEPAAAQWVSTLYTNTHIIESIPTGEQYGFAVSKDNPELLEAINDAMLTLKENGTFDEIFLRYFPDLTPPSLSAS